ncbi:MAG: NAD-dependent DNA ligase LigA [Bacillales bacterium]|nr:NAD-dependent DNA ligase LigA [Bacillales bacterium]
MNAKERIQELKSKINKANYEYYVSDNPSISDFEYDMMMAELIRLEEENPEYKTLDSPTLRVGGVALDKFRKVVHEKEMKSLSDLFSYEEVFSYLEGIEKITGKEEYSMELKIDGLAVSLKYEKGYLKEASTRGDGLVGEDITLNAKTINSVPLRLKEDIDVSVRGEIYLKKENFEKINEERKAQGEELFKNARNAAAGTIRQLDPKVVRKRGLDTFIYYLVDPEKYNIQTQSEALSFLKKLGFHVNPESKVVKNKKELIEYIEDIDQKRFSYSYDIDGVVMKYNYMKDYDKIGETAKYPKWATAYKFAPLEVKTKIRDIAFQVGRTGVITPVAILDPVNISGSTVSRATLNNEDYIISKDIRLNDTVYLRKAAEIIPEVVKVIKEERDESSLPFQMIKNCPKCGSPLIRREGEADWYCTNNLCDARRIEQLVHFAARDAYDIVGLGDKIVEFLYNEGFIHDISDIFNLKDYAEVLLTKEGFKERKVTSLIDSIEISKKNNLDRLLYGLGIKNVGKKVAKIICEKYRSIDEIMSLKEEDLSLISDIGDIIAKNVIDYFKDIKNIEEINKLKSSGLNMIYVSSKSEKESLFSGKTFVLTGTLKNYSREEAQKIIEDKGGKASSSVSSKTDYVLYGESAGSKLEKAKELNITLLTEEEFEEMIKE